MLSKMNKSVTLTATKYIFLYKRLMLFVVLFGVLESWMIFARVQRVCETEVSRIRDKTHTIFVSQSKWLATRVIPPLVEGHHGIFRENPSAFRVQVGSWMDNWDVIHPILLVSAMPGRNILVCHGALACIVVVLIVALIPEQHLFQTRHGTESTFDQLPNARDAAPGWNWHMPCARKKSCGFLCVAIFKNGLVSSPEQIYAQPLAISSCIYLPSCGLIS